MKDSVLGSFLARVLSVVARGMGFFLYWLLRAIYRPRDRAIALGGVAAVVAAIFLLIWMF